MGHKFKVHILLWQNSNHYLLVLVLKSIYYYGTNSNVHMGHKLKTHTLIIQSHILYIFIIDFCCLCSKLPGKIKSFYTKNYDVCWNQFATDFNIYCIQNGGSSRLFSVLTIHLLCIYVNFS